MYIGAVPFEVMKEGEVGILDRRVGLFLRNLASPSDLSCISFEIVIPSPF